MKNAHRGLVFCAGVVGAAGVGLSAVAAHKGGANLGIAASFLVANAPALLAIALLSSRVARTGGLILVAGLALFCGDLAARDLLGASILPYSAPTGGTLLILGWLVVATSALVRHRDL